MSSSTAVPDLELKELDKWRGTEKYHKLNFGFLATDGVEYVMDNGYAWVVTDALAHVITDRRLREEGFLTIELRNLKDNTVDLVITDGNDNILKKQHYSYTDAKREIKLYLIDKVVLLPSEY